MTMLQTQKSRGGLAKVTAAATDPTSNKGIVMDESIFRTGQRVSVSGRSGCIREVSAPTVNSALVEFDAPLPGHFTRHAFVWASDLELLDDDPLESHDAANGALWPRTIEEVCDFAEALNVQPSAVMFALEHMRSKRPDWVPFQERITPVDSPADGKRAKRPDYQQMEAATLADPESKPAGDDD